MRGSGVTAARSCLQPLVSASRYLAVHALPGDSLYFVVEAKSRVKEVYAQTCSLLGQQGMRDCELFGLAILSDGEYLFVDPESKLSKYAPKNWRSSHTYGLDSSGRPAFVLYFRVRYYVDTPLLLSDETTRHHYYLQLRDNVVRHGGGVESLHPHHPLHRPEIVNPLLALAGLALQADLGDYSEERHRPHAGSVGYCKPSDYLPPHMCLEANVVTILSAQHRDNRGLSREEAELQYIREAVLLEAPLNAHLYRLRRTKSEAGPGRILLAICARGVRVYTEEQTPRVFAWNNIGKLCFDRKKFEIRAVDHPDKLTLYSGCDDKSKLLLGLCRDTHQFSMAIAPRVTEARRREEEERKVLRDCYMYPSRCKLTMTTRSIREDQRISVISSTSSNTTSGIVSDRVHSEDEPDTAPASTECLARIAENTKTSLVIAGESQDPCTRASSPTSNIADEVDGNETSVINMVNISTSITTTTATTTSSSAIPISSVTRVGAEGSQCSSNCSTVVINSTPGKSRTSTNSSLELGYSHTAQNSVISGETNNYNGSIYSKKSNNVVGNLTVDEGTDIASETSGVYTLRSSAIQDESIAELYSPTSGTNVSVAASDVCALSSVQSTTDEASVTSGFYTIHSGLRSESDVYTEDTNQDDENGEDQEPIYSVCKGDDDVQNRSADNGTISQSDNVRSRSNSILSASSFRGDGSDPSGVGPLLSADELSDLIVGRYPPRKTISTSMDSDCDYVTMPPPPAPPPRIDSNEKKILTPPPYPSSFNYAMRNSSRVSIPSTKDREPPPPPPYNAPRLDFLPLPARRSDPPPPPPPYTSSRERIQIPPPTPPRNDAITPREPPPPPPYPSISSIVCQEAISKLYPSVGEEFSSSKVGNYNSLGRNVAVKPVISLLNSTKINSTTNDIIPVPKPPPRIQPPTYPGDKMKPTPVHAPVAALVVGPNNYLDVHASRSTPVLLPYLAPPASHSRQPPPPPPQPSSSLATVYTSQVSKSQIEQYRQQLYSDVDYVVFPLKDPAVSKQEYIDAKQGSMLSGMAAYPPPPPYPSFNNKSSVVYRSTPYLPGSSFSSSSKYASNFNLSDTSSNYLINGNLSSHYAASTSSLYSGATCSSSVGSQSLRREPIPVPTNSINHFSNFSRTRSDENILKCFEPSINNNLQPLPQTKHRRLPPPPPPPPYEIQNLAKNQPLPSSSTSQIPNSSEPSTDGIEKEDGGKDNGMLDIRTLREKSRNLDLPLISALCNDRYLLKQTKAFVLPKHPVESTNGGGNSPTNKTTTATIATSTSSSANINNSSNNSTLSRTKYPVSGLTSTQISKPPRKPSTSTHRHPSSSQVKGNSYKINHSNPTKVSNNKDPSRLSHS